MDVNGKEELHRKWSNNPDLLAGILATAMDAIIVIEDSQRIILFNTAAETMFGCSAREAIGSSLERFIPERFREAHRTHVRQFGETGLTKRTMGGGRVSKLWGLHADGNEFPIGASIAQSTIGGSKIFTVVIRDITERVHAEDVLKNSERRRREWVVYSPVAMVVSRGPRYECELVNLKFTELFGYTIEDMPDEAHWWPLAYPDEEYREALKAEWQERIRKAVSRHQHQIEPMEAVVQCKDGSKRHIEFHFAFLAETNLVSFVDLTERRRAEEAMRKSEQKFSKVFRQNPTALTLTSARDHRYLDVNDAFERVTGWRRDEVLGRTPLDIAMWVDPAERVSFVMNLLAGGVFHGKEVRYRRKDGTERVALSSAEIIEIEDEPYILSAIADITERQRSEQERLLSERRFRQFFETMPEYCYTVSPKGEIIDANLAACSVLGYSRDELVGKPLSQIYAPECHPKLHDLLKRWMADGVLRDEEMVIITRQGQRRTVLLNVGSVRDCDGNLLHSTSVQFDITDRKLAEQKVRESEERFRLVANTAPVMIWMAGSDKLCNYFNKPWLDFTGRTLAQELGNGWAEGVHGEDFVPCLKAYTEAFNKREPFEMEYRLRRHDGEYRWILDTGVPRFNENGTFAGYIGSCIDVTERKRAQEELSTMGHKLIKAHEEERTRIGRELHDDVTQRLALLAVELDQWSKEPSQRDFSDPLSQAQKRIMEICKDVQHLSHRLHSSKLEYLGLAAAARSFCKELSEKAQIEVQFRHSAVSSTMPKEVSLCLFRVLQEALQNAVKHSGVRTFKVELHGASDGIELMVSDDGKGFEERDAFFRKGLGLISMRERLQLVHGELLVNSKPGAGTKITARVPLKAVPAESGITEKRS